MLEKWLPYFTDTARQYVKELIDKGINVTSATKKMCEHFNLADNSYVEKNYRRFYPNDNNLNKVENDADFINAKNKVFNSQKKRFIITWAQAETKINEQFFENIKSYADFINADIHVIAGRYKNPSSLEASENQKKKDKNKVFWDAKLIPYLDANRQKIHENLCILGDIKIQPTASTPLSGLNSITALESCILGHPRVHLKSLPVLDDYPNKLLLTTGAVTIPNYTDTKIGAKSEFHHTYGFVIIELDGDIYHLRQVQCSDDGSFYDLDTFIDNGECIKVVESYPVMVFGDLHYGSHSEINLEQSLNIARKLKVNKIVLHDIFDGKSVNHHELKNPFAQLRNEQTGEHDLEAEIDNVIGFLNDNKDLNFLIISSNHDDFLDRWLQSNDWRKSGNRKAYLKYANIVANDLAPNGIIQYVINESTNNAECLGLNSSYRVNGWELSQHGHIGVNGSRGSVAQFKNLNTKTITAHSHTPAREDGSIVVGTLTNKRLGYNNGATSWMHSNVILYPNGKASHINLINGKYTTL
jgi:hypothetical protein